jgi:hypothetical protein
MYGSPSRTREAGRKDRERGNGGLSLVGFFRVLASSIRQRLGGAEVGVSPHHLGAIDCVTAAGDVDDDEGVPVHGMGGASTDE